MGNHLVYPHFAMGGRYLSLVLALECHFPGVGLGGFDVTCLRSLLLGNLRRLKGFLRQASRGKSLTT